MRQPDEDKGYLDEWHLNPCSRRRQNRNERELGLNICGLNTHHSLGLPSKGRLGQPHVKALTSLPDIVFCRLWSQPRPQPDTGTDLLNRSKSCPPARCNHHNYLFYTNQEHQPVAKKFFTYFSLSEFRHRDTASRVKETPIRRGPAKIERSRTRHVKDRLNR